MLYELHPEWGCITFNLKLHLYFCFCQFNCTSTPSEIGIKNATGFRYLWRVDIGKSYLFYRQWNVFCYCILLNLYNYYFSSSTSTITNQFCLEIIHCRVCSSFDYLIYPYYPAYTG